MRNRFWTSETTCTITDCRLVEDTSDCPADLACRWRERRGSMLANDRPQTTQTTVRHAMTRGKSASPTPHQKFARIGRRNISDRLSVCSHGLSGLSRRTDIQFATPPHIPIHHHLLLHPCPSCRTFTIYNTPHHALHPAQCFAHRTLHHTPAHHNICDLVHTARSYPSCLCC